ncbi:hypothetical protein, unlikely [Anopheles sinensis]|uniref:Uncharacterized protein n=1 Tax=Anopheles sinensis TaxID=74873 RepID=A0A084VWJ2_ANOSI|nr:hypothetical protein, unlikely [Anopheles sinensis]
MQVFAEACKETANSISLDGFIWIFLPINEPPRKKPPQGVDGCGESSSNATGPVRYQMGVPILATPASPAFPPLKSRENPVRRRQHCRVATSCPAQSGSRSLTHRLVRNRVARGRSREEPVEGHG